MNSLHEELEGVEAELIGVEKEIQEILSRQSSLIERKAELQAAIEESNACNSGKQAKVWDGTDFSWTLDLDKKLKEVFKLSSLRPMQRQTMNASLANEDVLLIMPTGGGKSLCFQLPSLVDKGLTLVVSPLVSLMEDQLMALEQLNVPATMLNASTSKEMLKFVQNEMVSAQSRLKLLYVTPEKLAKSKRFMNQLEKCYNLGRLVRLVIDEVHCCSQWGHDFRPDYKFLGIMKRQFPKTPILGLTATATSAVLEDVKKILNIPKAILFKASFNRPNLFYEVCAKPSSQKETIDELCDMIKRRFCGKSGIVYCFSRRESEEVATDLVSRGISANCYHADMDAQSRSQVHRSWLFGNTQVVVATVAFGMGIDKPDVRFVIHHSISKSMENLYQESGRAGRDDQRADCIVMYRFADVNRQSSMVFTEQTGLQNLHGVVKYCIDRSRCRRSLLARHFGEVWDSSDCNNMCDHCERIGKGGTTKAKEVTKYCQDVITLLDAAAAIEQRVTSAKLVDAWYRRGPSALKVKSVSVPPLTRDTAERILANMLVLGYLQEDFHFTAYSTICYIVAGHKARLLRNNSLQVHMDFWERNSTPKSLDGTPDSSINKSHSSSSTSSIPSSSKNQSHSTPSSSKKQSNSTSSSSKNQSHSTPSSSSKNQSNSTPSSSSKNQSNSTPCKKSSSQSSKEPKSSETAHNKRKDSGESESLSAHNPGGHETSKQRSEHCESSTVHIKQQRKKERKGTNHTIDTEERMYLSSEDETNQQGKKADSSTKCKGGVQMQQSREKEKNNVKKSRKRPFVVSDDSDEDFDMSDTLSKKSKNTSIVISDESD